MSSKRISQLDSTVLLTGAELIPIVQPVEDPKDNRKITLQQIVSFVEGELGAGLESFSVGNFSPLFTASLGVDPLLNPNLTFSAIAQNANVVFAGPATGGAANPTFRSLVAADIPNLSSTYQPLDADLSAIAALGFASTSFLKKTGANTWALDTTAYLPLSGGTLVGALTLSADAASALQPVTLQQMNAALVGLWDDRGNFTPSGNYPSTNGSGTAGAILKGDIYTISGLGAGVTALMGTKSVKDGDTVRALIDTPGNTDGNWAINEGDLGYTPLSNTLNSALIFVGNASNLATAVAMSGEASIINTGAVTLSNAAVIAKVLTGYTSGAGTVAATDSILQAIQKLDGNSSTKWSLASGGTLTGIATITSNANSQHIFNGTWTATGNNQYHFSFQPSITGRAAQPSGEVVGAVVINPSLTSGSGSNTSILVGLLIQPTFNDNAASGVVHSYIRCFDGTNVRFQVTDTNVTMAGSTTLTITNGVAGPQISANSASLQLNATSASGNVLLQIASNSWFGVQASNSIGAIVFQVPTTVTSTATQQSSRNFNWAINEWTGSAAQTNYWTVRATQSTVTNQLSYWDLCFGTTGSAPSLTNLYLRIRNTDGAILIGATTNNTFTPNVTLDIIGGIANRQTTKAQITANQNDYAIGAQTTFRMSSDASRNVTGLTGGVDGKILIIFNVGTNDIVFTHEDGASTAANRITSSTAANITIAGGHSICLMYDATTSRWRDYSVR